MDLWNSLLAQSFPRISFVKPKLEKMSILLSRNLGRFPGILSLQRLSSSYMNWISFCESKGPAKIQYFFSKYFVAFEKAQQQFYSELFFRIWIKKLTTLSASRKIAFHSKCRIWVEEWLNFSSPPEFTSFLSFSRKFSTKIFWLYPLSVSCLLNYILILHHHLSHLHAKFLDYKQNEKLDNFKAAFHKWI